MRKRRRTGHVALAWAGAGAFGRRLRVSQCLDVRGFGQLHRELGQALALAQMAVAAGLAVW